MVAPIKLTPHVRGRIQELDARGLSSRAISEALAKEGKKVSHVAVCEALKETNPAKPAKATKRVAPKARPDDVDDLPDFSVPDDAPDEVVRLHARVRQVRDMITVAKAGVDDGETTAALFRDLVKLEIDLTKSLVGLTPPKPPDPADDPANVDARDYLRAKILDLVENAERRRGALCARCLGAMK